MMGVRIFRPKFKIRGLDPDPPGTVEHPSKSYGSKTETSFFRQARAAGWSPTKKGWPDFIIRKGKRIAFVEVKKSGAQELSAPQYTLLHELAAMGAECYVWSPAQGFYRIKKGGPFRQPAGRLGKVGDERGSQSPDTGAIAPSERAQVAGVTTATNGAQALAVTRRGK
jgi:hypothetical protein